MFFCVEFCIFNLVADECKIIKDFKITMVIEREIHNEKNSWIYI